MTFIQYSYLLVITLLLVGCTKAAITRRSKPSAKASSREKCSKRSMPDKAGYQLQPGGFAQDPRQRFAKAPNPQRLDKISGVLFEAQGRIEAQRPVCAVYFSNPLLGGDDKVILAEYLPNWDKRN
jgi:hypothetical protein